MEGGVLREDYGHFSIVSWGAVILLVGDDALWFDVGMQTLGLASESKPTDGIFKRLFWPTIENAYDLDLVSSQGFWVCLVVAALSFVMLLAARQFALALLIAITYSLAATGVRERSVAAAILIFLCYTADRVGGLFMGQVTLGVLPIVSMLLLFANVRATLLARQWKMGGSTEQTEEPELASSSFTEKLSNVMPSRVWPVGRYFFFPFAGILLALTVAGIFLYPSAHRKQLELQQQHDGETITLQPADK